MVANDADDTVPFGCNPAIPWHRLMQMFAGQQPRAHRRHRSKKMRTKAHFARIFFFCVHQSAPGVMGGFAIRYARLFPPRALSPLSHIPHMQITSSLHRVSLRHRMIIEYPLHPNRPMRFPIVFMCQHSLAFAFHRVSAALSKCRFVGIARVGLAFFPHTFFLSFDAATRRGLCTASAKPYICPGFVHSHLQIIVLCNLNYSYRRICIRSENLCVGLQVRKGRTSSARPFCQIPIYSSRSQYPAAAGCPSHRSMPFSPAEQAIRQLYLHIRRNAHAMDAGTVRRSNWQWVTSSAPPAEQGTSSAQSPCHMSSCPPVGRAVILERADQNLRKRMRSIH